MRVPELQSEDRIRALPCWNGSIEIVPLKGGLSNESHKVTDANGQHVVRFGKDYPFHHVYRDRELMTARAAHAAGFAPEIRYAEPGVMVSAFITGHTYTAIDVRQNRDRIAALIHRFHQDMPAHVNGTGFMFWVFHVIRDYVRTLEVAQSSWRSELPGYLKLNAELEAAQISLPIIFGHNDLLPANLIDDGEKIWLIDYEYAGFNTAMFDLSGIAANAEMPETEAIALIDAYFSAGPPANRKAMLQSFTAMQCAALLREAMWGMVSAIHLNAPGADYDAYARENLDRLETALQNFRKA